MKKKDLILLFSLITCALLTSCDSGTDEERNEYNMKPEIITSRQDSFLDSRIPRALLPT